MSWIKVNDSLPNFDSFDPIFRLESAPVLVYTNYKVMLVATLEADTDYPDNKLWYTADSEKWEITNNVTHWMKLPDAPKEA